MPGSSTAIDQRSFLGIPNFSDVTSNFPFAVVGIWGLIVLFRHDASATTGSLVDTRERWPYLRYNP
jgi:hypothetical protein